MKRFIEQEYIRGGQPRPYADHEYESYLIFTVPEGQGWSSKWPLTPEQVKPFVRALVHNFIEGSEREWHEPWLEKLELVSKDPIKWHVIIRSPYLD